MAGLPPYYLLSLGLIVCTSSSSLLICGLLLSVPLSCGMWNGLPDLALS